MVFNSQEIEHSLLFLPVTSEYRQIAQQFAAQQSTEKAEQVFLNTLAVLVVNSYLNMLGISTDLSSSDSWNLVIRAVSDVADLDVSGIGKLECRPVKISESNCRIPMDVWDLRIGYVVVQVDNLHKQAALLGFVPQVDSEELAITDLRPLEELIDRLHDLRESAASRSFTNLSQWLNDIFAAGWQTAESLLTSEQLSLAWGFRGQQSSPETVSASQAPSASRAKSVDLGIQLNHRSVVLLAQIREEEERMAVTLQVHPGANDTYLPEALELRVLEASEVFMQAQARSKDRCIQLQFRGQPEEGFEVQIVLESVRFSERFQL